MHIYNCVYKIVVSTMFMFSFSLHSYRMLIVAAAALLLILLLFGRVINIIAVVKIIMFIIN